MELQFDEKRHRYTLDGKSLTGVTTVLSVIAKPALIQWAANEAVGYIRENGTKFTGTAMAEPMWTVTESLLDQARTAHCRKKDKSADIGTLVHKAVEVWIKEGKEPELDEQGMRMFGKFKEWAQGKKFIASEQRVYSKEHWYAGTFDFLVEIEGKKYIGDLKTSSGIYGREYFAQMAGYRIALEEMGVANDIHGSVIVRCGKDGSFEEQFSYDYETDKKMFLAALDIYRISNNY